MSAFANGDLNNNSTYLSLPQSEVDDLDDVGCDLNATDWDMSPLDDHSSQLPMQSIGTQQDSPQVDANDVAANLVSSNNDLSTGGDFVAPSTQNLSVNSTADPNGNGPSISLLSNSNEHKSVDNTIDLNSDNLNGNGPASSNLNMNGLGANHASNHGATQPNASVPPFNTQSPKPSVSQFQLSNDAGKRAEKYKNAAQILSGYGMPTWRSLDRLNQCFDENDPKDVNSLFDFVRTGGTNKAQKQMVRATILGMIVQGSQLDEISDARDAMVAAFNSVDSAAKKNLEKAIKGILDEAGKSSVNILMNLREDPRFPELRSTAFAESNELVNQHRELSAELQNLHVDHKKQLDECAERERCIKDDAIGRIHQRSAPLDRARTELGAYLDSPNNGGPALPPFERNALTTFENELNGLNNEQKGVLRNCSGDQGAYVGRDSAFPNLLGLCSFLNRKGHGLRNYLPQSFLLAAGQVHNVLTDNNTDSDAKRQAIQGRYLHTPCRQELRNELIRETASSFHELQQEVNQLNANTQIKDQQIRNQMNNLGYQFDRVHAREVATLFDQGGTLSPYSKVFSDIVGNGNDEDNRHITEALHDIVPLLRNKTVDRVRLTDRLSRLDNTQKRRLNQLWQLPNFRSIVGNDDQTRQSAIRTILAAQILGTQPKNADGGISDQSFRTLENREVELSRMDIAHLQAEIERLNQQK